MPEGMKNIRDETKLLNDFGVYQEQRKTAQRITLSIRNRKER